MFHTCAALMEGFINISICWSSTPTLMFTSWLCMAASLRSQQNSSVSLHQHACFCSIILGCAFERNAVAAHAVDSAFPSCHRKTSL